MCLYSHCPNTNVGNMASMDGVQGKQAKEDLKSAAFICVLCARFFKFHDEFYLHVNKYCKLRPNAKNSIKVSSTEGHCNNDISQELQDTLNSLYQLQSSNSAGKRTVTKSNNTNSLPGHTPCDEDNTKQGSTYMKTEPTEYMESVSTPDTTYNLAMTDENFNFVSVKKEPVELSDQDNDFSYTSDDLNCDPDSLLAEQSMKLSCKKEKVTSNSPTADVLYVCDTCGKAFRQRSILQAHFVVHSEETPYKCSECGKAFKRKKGLQQHELTHMDRSKRVIQPRRKNMLQINERRFICFKCTKAFKTCYELKRHIKRHSEDRPLQCAECQKAFKNKQDLTRHVLTHTNTKPHSCDECGRSFISRSKLKRHQLSHSDLRTHICHLCSRGFKMKSVLEAHLLTHVKNTRFYCLLCPKSFGSRQGLWQHNKDHTTTSNNSHSQHFGEKPFQVSHTNKKRHAHKKLHSCKSCRKTFKSPSSLYVHALKNAKNECGKAFKKQFGIKSLHHFKDTNKICNNGNFKKTFMEEIAETN